MYLIRRFRFDLYSRNLAAYPGHSELFKVGVSELLFGTLPGIYHPRHSWTHE
jgi:hypothetical protein